MTAAKESQAFSSCPRPDWLRRYFRQSFTVTSLRPRLFTGSLQCQGISPRSSILMTVDTFTPSSSAISPVVYGFGLPDLRFFVTSLPLLALR